MHVCGITFVESVQHGFVNGKDKNSLFVRWRQIDRVNKVVKLTVGSHKLKVLNHVDCMLKMFLGELFNICYRYYLVSFVLRRATCNWGHAVAWWNKTSKRWNWFFVSCVFTWSNQVYTQKWCWRVCKFICHFYFIVIQGILFISLLSVWLLQLFYFSYQLHLLFLQGFCKSFPFQVLALCFIFIWFLRLWFILFHNSDLQLLFRRSCRI